MKGDWIVRFLVACVLGLFLTQCTGQLKSEGNFQSPLSQKISNAALFDALSIQGTDLPNGWDVGGIRPEDESGAEVRFYYYYDTSAQDLMWVSFSEELAIYSTKEAATQSYEGWSQKNIPPAYADRWKTAPELEFDNHADQMKIACMPGKIDQVPYSACVSVARYENIIVLVRGNVFTNQWLTMPDFRSILEAVDRRFTTTFLKE
jgi:hypothetical protein